MSQRIDGHAVSLILEKRQHEQIEKIAKRFGIKKAQAHRLLLDAGLDAYQAFEAIGLVKLAELTKKTRKACEKLVQPSLI